jgi:hypothetical protein
LWGLAEEGIASAIRPSAPAAHVSKEMTRKTPTSATMACDGLDVLVDRKHSLSPDYVPSDLVPLQEDHGVPTLGSEVLRLPTKIADSRLPENYRASEMRMEIKVPPT